MSRLSISLIVLLLTAQSISAQGNIKNAFLGKFNYTANRLIQLAEAMPADTYSWSPEGGMTVEHVYMHISRYNYLYAETNLHMEIPDDINLDTMEEITGKENVVAHLKRSMEFMRDLVEKTPEEEFLKPTELYGQNTQKWDVLFQLQAHMAEHTGQSLAYARVNGIVPPWSN